MNKQSVLLTGGAGFIGSHILDALLEDDRVGRVRVVDDLSTGRRENISQALKHPDCELIVGDIRSWETCEQVMDGMDRVCHQAALGSVPRSVNDPLSTHAVNSSGTLNVFQAAREAGIRRVVFASSSAVYGDEESMPKQEEKTGRPLSPYAETKRSSESYGEVFADLWKMEMIALRYFNVFGPRQNPRGPYAAVIPSFIKRMLNDRPPVIYGDGYQSRDFTYVELAVQANVKALFKPFKKPRFFPLNIACGERTTLNDLVELLGKLMGKDPKPIYEDPRPGDIRHSLADISRAGRMIDYHPGIDLSEGLSRTIEYFRIRSSSS